MKKLTLLIALVALSAFAFQAAFSQNTQSVSITVGAVALLTASGTATLTLSTSDIAVGSNDFNAVNSTGATSLSMTHNGGLLLTTAKITAGMDAVLGLGASLLKVTLASVNTGVSDGAVAIQDAITGTSDVQIEHAIPAGAGSGATTYTLSGVKASDGQFSESRTVTFTLTAD